MATQPYVRSTHTHDITLRAKPSHGHWQAVEYKHKDTSVEQAAANNTNSEKDQLTIASVYERKTQDRGT